MHDLQQSHIHKEDHMKKLIPCLLLTLLAAGCGTLYSAVDTSGDNTFEDNYLRITKHLEPLQVTIEITNTSTDDLEILWDECRYTDLAGKSYKIIHTDVTFDEEGNGINPPTLINSGETHTDFITPINAIKRREELHKYKTRMWATHRETTEQIYIVGGDVDYKNKKELLPLVGKSYTLLMVIRVDEEKREYPLVGTITGVVDLFK